MEANLHHLIIAAHPRARSFNHSIVETYTAALIESGHRVACRDLYAMGFNPILSARDIAAIARGKPPRDIRSELNAMGAADTITLISPLWWSGFPAMLKGYVDRVFTAGSTYLTKNKRPKLSGKKGTIVVTSGASVEELKSSGTRSLVAFFSCNRPMLQINSGGGDVGCLCKTSRSAPAYWFCRRNPTINAATGVASGWSAKRSTIRSCQGAGRSCLSALPNALMRSVSAVSTLSSDALTR